MMNSAAQPSRKLELGAPRCMRLQSCSERYAHVPQRLHCCITVVGCASRAACATRADPRTCTCIRMCEHHLIDMLCCSQGIVMQSCNCFRRSMYCLGTSIGLPPTISLTGTGMPDLNSRRRPSFLSMLSPTAVLCFLTVLTVNVVSAARADELCSDASAAEAQLSSFKTQLAGTRKLCLTNARTCEAL